MKRIPMPKTDIKIFVPGNSEHLEFDSHTIVTKKYDDNTLSIGDIDAVHYSNRLVTFDSVKVDLSLVYDGKAYEATLCTVTKKKSDEGWCYVTDSVLKMVNRRNAVRTPCHESITLKDNGKDFGDIYTYDVSLNGIGIYARKDETDVKIGTECIVSIQTDKTKSIKIPGIIARVNPVNNDDIFIRIGIAIPKPTKEYTEFVMSVQRKLLQQKRKE